MANRNALDLDKIVLHVDFCDVQHSLRQLASRSHRGSALLGRLVALSTLRFCQHKLFALALHPALPQSTAVEWARRLIESLA